MRENNLRVLFVSRELIGADLAYRLVKEGCDVKIFIEDESRKDCLENMVEKTDDWRKELDWVGKDGLIVFDDVGYGEEQDLLRKSGYYVFGGSAGGDQLELNREHCQKVLLDNGIMPLPTKRFEYIDDAIAFVKKNKNAWVVKQNGHISFLNYVGKMKNGEDAISILKDYKKYEDRIKYVSLQEKVEGIELAVGRFFDREKWVGPICLNVEHKALFNEGIGPMTGEMGTVLWYTSNEQNLLFQKTLSCLTDYLANVGHSGYVDINCIINRNDVFPIDFTARLGCPTIQLQVEMQKSSMYSLIRSVSSGIESKIGYKNGYGVVVSIAVPPFPYVSIRNVYHLGGVQIFFQETLTKREMDQLHFEEVSCGKKSSEDLYIAGSNGFVLYVTGSGITVDAARKDAYSVIEKICIPKMFYRTDIGRKFIDEDKALLEKWGWIG